MEDYKKKYEDALERARQVHTTNVDENKKSTEYIFPELKENEDEMVRKSIIAHLQKEYVLKQIDARIYDAWSAWLEKVKDLDKQLESAYKRGYYDGYLEGIVNAKKELEKQGEMDDIETDIEKPITIGKRRAVSGKLKELIDNKDPKSIEETKEKMLAETSNWTDEDESICKDLISYFNYQPLKHSDDLVCNWLKSIKTRLQ